MTPPVMRRFGVPRRPSARRSHRMASREPARSRRCEESAPPGEYLDRPAVGPRARRSVGGLSKTEHGVLGGDPSPPLRGGVVGTSRYAGPPLSGAFLPSRKARAGAGRSQVGVPQRALFIIRTSLSGRALFICRLALEVFEVFYLLRDVLVIRVVVPAAPDLVQAGRCRWRYSTDGLLVVGLGLQSVLDGNDLG